LLEGGGEQQHHLCTTVSQLLHPLTAPKPNTRAQAAAEWLIERDVVEAESSWRQQQQEGRDDALRSRRERQKTKQAILARFDLQAVKEPTDGRAKERPLEAWATGKQQKQQKPAGKIRYRDGVIVSSSGEKYVIQKPPEFDGGSRGKVYTKGKRGKGFV